MRGAMGGMLRFLIGLSALALILPNRVGRWLVGAVLVLVVAVPVLIGAVLAIGGLWLFGSPIAAVRIG